MAFATALSTPDFFDPRSDTNVIRYCASEEIRQNASPPVTTFFSDAHFDSPFDALGMLCAEITHYTKRKPSKFPYFVSALRIDEPSRIEVSGHSQDAAELSILNTIITPSKFTDGKHVELHATRIDRGASVPSGPVDALRDLDVSGLGGPDRTEMSIGIQQRDGFYSVVCIIRSLTKFGAIRAAGAELEDVIEQLNLGLKGHTFLRSIKELRAIIATKSAALTGLKQRIQED